MRRALLLLATMSLVAGCRFAGAAGRAATSLVTSPLAVEKSKHPVQANARLAVLWIGHATALIQIDDKIILTDPVFTSSVGQLSRRLVEPGLDPADLPPVDAVLISHLHFDHLSLGSLDMIEKKVRALFLPTGGTAYLTDFGFPSTELRPWQTWEKSGLRVTAVPVQHVGYRYGLDAAWMTTSFTGYVIEYHGIRVYFGGDTAYDQRNFLETAARFPDLDLALLPISPIEPHSLMRVYHMDPDEAFQAFLDLRARRMVPIHFDTFVNSTDVPGEALRRLRAARARVTLDPGVEIYPLPIGGEPKVFVRAGEDPHPALPKARSVAVPTPAPAPAAPPKSEIPDDDKLD